MYIKVCMDYETKGQWINAASSTKQICGGCKHT